MSSHAAFVPADGPEQPMDENKVTPQELERFGHPEMNTLDKIQAIQEQHRRVRQGLPPQPTPQENWNAWWGLGEFALILIIIRLLFYVVQKRRARK